MVSGVLKIVSPLDHPDFSTHKHYISYLRRISNDLRLTLSCELSRGTTVAPLARKKVRLIELTLENIRSEAQMVVKPPENGQAAISWLPVKAYYLIFNLTILLEYLVSANPLLLLSTHEGSLDRFKRLLEGTSISFSEPAFNEIRRGDEIEKMKVEKSDNIRQTTITRKEQVYRKFLDYKRESVRRRARVKRLKKVQMSEIRNRDFSLSEVFYWYRIKANYGDLEFISDKVPASEFKELYTQYCFLTANFYKALKKCVNEASLARTGEILLK